MRYYCKCGLDFDSYMAREQHRDSILRCPGEDWKKRIEKMRELNAAKKKPHVVNCNCSDCTYYEIREGVYRGLLEESKEKQRQEDK